MYKIKLITGFDNIQVAEEVEKYMNELSVEYTFDIKYSHTRDCHVNELLHSVLIIARRK